MKDQLEYIGITVIFCIVSVFLGYFWRIHHEKEIFKKYKSEAEMRLLNIEESLEDGRPFTLFGKYKIIRGYKNTYLYKECK